MEEAWGPSCGDDESLYLDVVCCSAGYGCRVNRACVR